MPHRTRSGLRSHTRSVVHWVHVNVCSQNPRGLGVFVWSSADKSIWQCGTGLVGWNCKSFKKLLSLEETMLRTAISRAGNSRLSNNRDAPCPGIAIGTARMRQRSGPSRASLLRSERLLRLRRENCYPVPGDATKPSMRRPLRCRRDSDAACGAGRVCDIGKCVAACTDNSACKVGNNCVAGRCRPTDAATCGLVDRCARPIRRVPADRPA